MKIKNQLSLGRLIGKLDNDFNISESDWIPRVAAWVIDALSQMKILPMEKKKRELEVSERIAQFPCKLNTKEIRLFDTNGCEIYQLDGKSNCCSTKQINPISGEVSVIDVTNKTGINFMQTGTVVNKIADRNFVIQGDNIELNFDTDKVIAETFEVATYYDEYYDCEVPYIYDDGLLLEALAWYVMYKYLSRGSKHPVFSIESQSPALNPFIQWTQLKPKAMASVRNSINKANDDLWRSFFYNFTFSPRG